jgi:hypothetical protein
MNRGSALLMQEEKILIYFKVQPERFLVEIKESTKILRKVEHRTQGAPEYETGVLTARPPWPGKRR